MTTPTHTKARADYTAGPWETSSNAAGEWDICAADAGDMIADLRDCENAEANARLIAAAPELLEACRNAQREIINHESGHHQQFQAVWQQLRTAIARATAEKGGIYGMD